MFCFLIYPIIDMHRFNWLVDRSISNCWFLLFRIALSFWKKHFLMLWMMYLIVLHSSHALLSWMHIKNLVLCSSRFADICLFFIWLLHSPCPNRVGPATCMRAYIQKQYMLSYTYIHIYVSRPMIYRHVMHGQTCIITCICVCSCL